MTTNGTEERPLPDGWTWTTGGNLFKWASGKNLPQKKLREGSIPVFGGNGIGGFHDESLVEHPTLVIGRVGAHCGNVHLTKGESWITDNAIYARELSDTISLKFAQIAFQLAKLNEQATGSGQPFVNQRMLNEVELLLPPLTEQERIVAEIEKQFTRLDQAVVSLRRLQSNLARYKASVLKAACEGRLVPQHPSDEPAADLLARILTERRAQWQAANPGKKYKEPVGVEETAVLPDLPEGWVWTSVDQLGDVLGGLTKNSKRKVLPLEMPYLRVANVYANELKLEDVSTIGVRESELERVLLEENDLLVVEGNGSVDQIGRVALWNGSISPCVHQNHLIKVRFLKKEIPDFVLYWLLSPNGRKAIQQVASSTSGLYTLSLSKVRALPVPLPPLAEQERIVAEVERRLSVVTAVEQTIAANLSRAERLRQSILHRAFTGQLMPQEGVA